MNRVTKTTFVHTTHVHSLCKYPSMKIECSVSIEMLIAKWLSNATGRKVANLWDDHKTLYCFICLQDAAN